jgi:hypothetical protein
MARPKGSVKKVNLERLRNLAMIGCSHQVIASECGISHDSLTRNYAAEVEAARGTGKRRVLAKAFQMAMKGNTKIVELLLVNWCGFSLRPETVVSVQTNYAAPSLTMSEFRRQVAESEQLLRAYLDGQSPTHQLTDADDTGAGAI